MSNDVELQAAIYKTKFLIEHRQPSSNVHTYSRTTVPESQRSPRKPFRKGELSISNVYSIMFEQSAVTRADYTNARKEPVVKKKRAKMPDERGERETGNGQ